MEELLSPTVVVPDWEQGALDQFRKLYGHSSFACRHSLCAASLERYLTIDERGKHEQSHFERWKCDDPQCLFFGKGLTSPQALKSHNQKYHAKAIPVVNTPNASQIIGSVVHRSNQENNTSAKRSCSAQSVRCRGTLPSGGIWGCGDSFLDAPALRAHWLSPSGLKCKDALREGLSLPSSSIASTAPIVRDQSAKTRTPQTKFDDKADMSNNPTASATYQPDTELHSSSIPPAPILSNSIPVDILSNPSSDYLMVSTEAHIPAWEGYEPAHHTDEIVDPLPSLVSRKEIDHKLAP